VSVPVQAPVLARASVYRAMFARNASSLGDRAASFCVGKGSGARLADPDAALLAALGDVAKVRPASSCDAGPSGERVVDRSTGQPALLFGVETAECTSTKECTLYGGYYEANLSSRRDLYRASSKNGVWTVVVETLGPIS